MKFRRTDNGKIHKIFLAEDDEDLKNLYEQLLTSYGYRIIETAKDGKEAINKYKILLEKIQENVTIHNEVGSTVEIGDNCIVGHHAMVHGPCTIGNGCLVGIGANVLHRSKMGDGSIVGAGAVLVGKEIPPRTLAVGVPAKIKKQLSQTGKLEGLKSSGVYADNGKLFKELFKKNS